MELVTGGTDVLSSWQGSLKTLGGMLVGVSVRLRTSFSPGDVSIGIILLSSTGTKKVKANKYSQHIY